MRSMASEASDVDPRHNAAGRPALQAAHISQDFRPNASAASTISRPGDRATKGWSPGEARVFHGSSGSISAVVEARPPPSPSSGVGGRAAPRSCEVATRARQASPWTDDTLIGAARDAATARSRDRDRCAADPDRVRPLRAPGVPGHGGVRRSRGGLAAHRPAARSSRRSPPRSVGGGSATARAARRAGAARAVRASRDRRRDDVPARPPAARRSSARANGAIAARAGQLRKRLRGAGYELHGNLLEVSPAATIAALCGTARRARLQARRRSVARRARMILEQLADLVVRAAEPDGARGRAAATITASTP